MTEFLTATQAATVIGVSRRTLHDMIGDGRIYAAWVLEKWAVPKSEVMRVKGERAAIKRERAERAKRAQKTKK